MKHLLVFFSLAFFSRSFAQNFYQQTSEAKHWVDSVFKTLSKEERIAQLMVVRLSAKTPDGIVFYDKQVEEGTDAERHAEVNGVLRYAEHGKHAEQQKVQVINNHADRGVRKPTG